MSVFFGCLVFIAAFAFLGALGAHDWIGAGVLGVGLLALLWRMEAGAHD